MRITEAVSPDDLDAVRALFLEYAHALSVDLGYQGFDDEVRSLPGSYVRPSGALLLARTDGGVVGCAGVRAFDETTAEMKRLYVRPEGRGLGVGRSLALAAITFARDGGYDRMRLDTLPEMRSAQALYLSLGFRPIDMYRFSPVPGTVFLELAL